LARAAPRGKRVKKPTNAAEQFFFDFYYKEPELSDWEKKLKARRAAHALAARVPG
jgi:hypothetical protein